MLLITDDQVNQSLSVRDCVDAMEDSFRDLSEGSANDTPRERMFVGAANDPKLYSLGRQCGAIQRSKVAALRVMSNRRAEVRGPKDNHFILLFSTETGQLLALIQGFTLSGLRLGATTACRRNTWRLNTSWKWEFWHRQTGAGQLQRGSPL